MNRREKKWLRRSGRTTGRKLVSEEGQLEVNAVKGEPLRGILLWFEETEYNLL